MKKAGFTLSEVLIAVSIISILLVVTVPVVSSHMNKKTQVTQLQSVYSAVNTAVGLMMTDERVRDIRQSSLAYPSESVDIPGTAGYFIKKYFNVTKDCGTKSEGCFADSYKNLKREDAQTLPDGTAYFAMISSGAAIAIRPRSSDASEALDVVVDVNGPAIPNIAGRDLFQFWIYDDGFVGSKHNYANSNSLTIACRESLYGNDCFDRVVNAGWVMDY